jgi:hypothetical protein
MFLAVLALGGAMDGYAGARDTLLLRLDQARQLSLQTGRQLDSLRRVIERMPAGDSVVSFRAALSREDAAIWREVRAERERRKDLEAAFDFRRAALGYVFNPNLVFGMNGVFWHGDWGARLDGRFAFVESRRALGGNLSLLYAIHEFYLTGEEMFTRLYLFGGAGYYWERRLNNSTDSWYDTPDRAFRTQFGAGTELGLREMYGTRFTPEIGFQGSRFLSRYNDSPDYGGDRPSSDYSLYPYYALHINFYFL